MDAFEGLSSLVKIDGQEDCLPRIQWDPLDDSMETLLVAWMLCTSKLEVD